MRCQNRWNILSNSIFEQSAAKRAIEDSIDVNHIGLDLVDDVLPVERRRHIHDLMAIFFEPLIEPRIGGEWMKQITIGTHDPKVNVF